MYTDFTLHFKPPFFPAFQLNVIFFLYCILNPLYFSDECDDETCRDLSEINENTHRQIDTTENTHTQSDTENHGLAPSIRVRRSSNSDTENQCLERNRGNGDNCLV